MMLSIATAVLGFASTPHDHCVGGHTGNLAFGGTVGISCDTPDLKCYNHDDGSEAWGFEFAGSMYKTSDVCPQACGICHNMEIFYRGAIGGGKDEL